MIQANELRLGNLVQYPNYNYDGTIKYFKIRDIYTDDDKISLTDGRIQLPSSSLKHIKSIPLTPEWLMKCGFKVTYSLNYESKIGALTIIARIYSGVLYMEVGGIYLGDRIKFVHEYQNLYHSLTGQELEVKL